MLTALTGVAMEFYTLDIRQSKSRIPRNAVALQGRHAALLLQRAR